MKIIKKNQLTILVLSLMLVTAGYFNYNTNLNKEIEVSSMQEENRVNVGEAVFVASEEINEPDIQETLNEEDNIIQTSSKTEENTKDYYINTRLDREKMYSQILETYKSILESDNMSEVQKSIATTEIERINSQKNAIMVSENLIKNKGFSECVVLVNDESINIIVEADDMQQEQISQIQNIISREMGAEIENIHISKKINN